MNCVLCGRALFSAALSVPTRNGPLAYGPKCARKAGLVQRTSHVQKKAPRPGKAPANTIDVYVDTHTMSLFEETAC